MCVRTAGVPKHHICNANLMKNGADFAVFVNTAQEFDGSDSGARARGPRVVNAGGGAGPPACLPLCPPAQRRRS